MKILESNQLITIHGGVANPILHGCVNALPFVGLLEGGVIGLQISIDKDHPMNSILNSVLGTLIGAGAGFMSGLVPAISLNQIISN